MHARCKSSRDLQYILIREQCTVRTILLTKTKEDKREIAAFMLL